MASKRNAFVLALCAGVLCMWTWQALAQQPVTVTGPDGSEMKVMVAPGDAEAKVMPMPEAMPGAESPKPGEPSKRGAAKGASGAEKGKPDEKKPPAIQRPTAPPKPPDPNELKVRPDKAGNLTFNFRNQPWQGVLEWLADCSAMSLDWQELPGDYLNLTTPPGRSYTVLETRDLINRHLLARGYTLLSQGNILSVASVGKLNPAMVPRVDRERLDEIAKQEPNAFVKVTVPLDWMLADVAVEELKPMLSPNGKLTALKGSNRLEAMDAAANLRDILQVLATEQSPQRQEGLVRPFRLKYAKASDVHEQLRELLGLEAKPGRAKTPGSPNQAEEEARRMAMMRGGGPMMMEGQPGGPQPGQPGGPGGPGGMAKPKTAEINFTINQRENSIIAVAPPDKMMIIAQAIKALDVPGNEGESLLGTMQRWHVYHLASIEPEPIIQTLQDLGNLDPRTRLQADKKNRAIVVYAPLADHVMINSLIERLDGSARQFHVIPLKRLEAEYVAGTIEFMMTGERGEKKQPQRSRYSYFYGMDSGSSSSQKEESTDKFYVEPDIERNRIILKANPIELQEVQNLLEKLGENTGAGDSPTIRVIDLPAGKDADELLERIRRHWPSVGPNPLILPPAEEPKEKGSPAAPKAEPLKTESPRPSAPAKRTAARDEPSAADPGVTPGAVAVSVALAPEPSPPTPAGGTGVSPSLAPGGTGVSPVLAPSTGKMPVPPVAASGTGVSPGAPPPVTITRTPDGKLMITSLDTRALDRLEDLITQLSPSGRPDYQIFKLKYALASAVATVLKDIFKDGEKQQRVPLWMQLEYGVGDSSSDKGAGRLSKRRPLKIVSEYDTNSILVQGADATQLKTIKELVEFYDKPEPPDAQSVHQTQNFVLQWTKAEIVAETIKDLYRDLLSPKDKALNNQQQDQQRRPFVISLYGDDSSGEGEGQKRPRFQGLLSIGVDKVSNTLVVSAPPYLMKDVSKLIKELDQAAMPSDTVSVLQLGKGVNVQQFEAAITKLMGDPTKVGAGRGQQGQQGQGQQGQGDRRRNRDASGRGGRGN